MSRHQFLLAILLSLAVTLVTSAIRGGTNPALASDDPAKRTRNGPGISVAPPSIQRSGTDVALVFQVTNHGSTATVVTGAFVVADVGGTTLAADTLQIAAIPPHASAPATVMLPPQYPFTYVLVALGLEDDRGNWVGYGPTRVTLVPIPGPPATSDRADTLAPAAAHAPATPAMTFPSPSLADSQSTHPRDERRGPGREWSWQGVGIAGGLVLLFAGGIALDSWRTRRLIVAASSSSAIETPSWERGADSTAGLLDARRSVEGELVPPVLRQPSTAAETLLAALETIAPAEPPSSPVSQRRAVASSSPRRRRADDPERVILWSRASPS